VCEGLASRVHFALCGCHGKHNKSMVPCVSEIMIKNKKKLSHWTKTWHVQTVVVMWRLVWYAVMLAKQQTNFHGIQVIGTNQTSGMTATKWFIAALFIVPWHINKPPIYEAVSATFVEHPSFHSLDTCENKWFDKRNAH